VLLAIVTQYFVSRFSLKSQPAGMYSFDMIHASLKDSTNCSGFRIMVWAVLTSMLLTVSRRKPTASFESVWHVPFLVVYYTLKHTLRPWKKKFGGGSYFIEGSNKSRSFFWRGGGVAMEIVNNFWDGFFFVSHGIMWGNPSKKTWRPVLGGNHIKSGFGSQRMCGM